MLFIITIIIVAVVCKFIVHLPLDNLGQSTTVKSLLFTLSIFCFIKTNRTMIDWALFSVGWGHVTCIAIYAWTILPPSSISSALRTLFICTRICLFVAYVHTLVPLFSEFLENLISVAFGPVSPFGPPPKTSLN